MKNYSMGQARRIARKQEPGIRKEKKQTLLQQKAGVRAANIGVLV